MQVFVSQFFIPKSNRRREDVIYHGLHGFTQILILFEIKKSVQIRVIRGA
jgi:hypothetical protein